jgi:hypothetical protein
LSKKGKGNGKGKRRSRSLRDDNQKGNGNGNGEIKGTDTAKDSAQRFAGGVGWARVIPCWTTRWLVDSGFLCAGDVEVNIRLIDQGRAGVDKHRKGREGVDGVIGFERFVRVFMDLSEGL